MNNILNYEAANLEDNPIYNKLLELLIYAPAKVENMLKKYVDSLSLESSSRYDEEYLQRHYQKHFRERTLKELSKFWHNYRIEEIRKETFCLKPQHYGSHDKLDVENARQPCESLQGDDGFLSIIFQAFYPKEPSDLSKHQGYFSVTDYTLIRVGAIPSPISLREQAI